jgi:DnaJ-class molecular chaperone
MRVELDIIICRNCNGTGFYNIYSTSCQKCWSCQGEGLVINR